MQSIYFNVSSVTNAMRGKSILENAGIQGYVNRSIEENGSNGCGYSILVTDNIDKAEKLLLNAGIRIRGKVPAKNR